MKTHRISPSALQEKPSVLIKDSTTPIIRTILASIMALAFWLGGANPLHATALTGSGSNLPLGTFVTAYSKADPAYTETLNVSFTGTWNALAAASWVGTFSATGPVPAGTRNTGNTNYDFTALAAGAAAAGTFFFIADLDNTEHITLKAFDATNTLITTPWLENPLEQSGTSGQGGPPQLVDMPGWSWNSITGVYAFDGSTAGGGFNPNVGFELTNNVAVGHLTVNRDDQNTSFSVGAPLAVPEPSSVALLACGLGLLLVHRRKATAG